MEEKRVVTETEQQFELNLSSDKFFRRLTEIILIMLTLCLYGLVLVRVWFLLLMVLMLLSMLLL